MDEGRPSLSRTVAVGPHIRPDLIGQSRSDLMNMVKSFVPPNADVNQCRVSTFPFETMLPALKLTPSHQVCAASFEVPHQCKKRLNSMIRENLEINFVASSALTPPIPWHNYHATLRSGWASRSCMSDHTLRRCRRLRMKSLSNSRHGSEATVLGKVMV